MDISVHRVIELPSEWQFVNFTDNNRDVSLSAYRYHGIKQVLLLSGSNLCTVSTIDIYIMIRFSELKMENMRFVLVIILCNVLFLH